MRYTRFVPWILMTASFAVTGIVAAQSSAAPSRIYVIDYMKVEPGDGDRYVEMETEWWKPVHAERIRRGDMHSWGLYRVRWPDGTAKAYDFVTVNVYDSYADSDKDPLAVFREVHPDADRHEVERNTLESRRLVRGEIWYRIDHLE